MKAAQNRKCAIVNADDLGFSPGVNEGIFRAHSEGIVTSATVAANMPAAVGAVKRLAAFPGLGVGVHLNASQGPPLSAEGRVLAGEDGVMNRTATGLVAACFVRPRLLRAVRAEFDAQIRWVLDHGIRPTHLDTHRHAHAFGPIFVCVRDLARHYNIHFVRWPGEVLAGCGWPEAPASQRRARWLLNRLSGMSAQRDGGLRGAGGTWGIAHTGLIGVDWLLCAAWNLPPGVTEIMTHPAAADDLPVGLTRLRACRLKELAALCDPAVKAAFAENEIELIHYGQL